MPISESVLTSIIAGASALLGVTISQFIEFIRRRSEDKRWYLKHFLERKFNSLNDLYGAVQDCHSSMLDHLILGTSFSTLDAFYEKINKKYAAYLRSATMAYPYLNPDQWKILKRQTVVFERANAIILSRLPANETAGFPDLSAKLQQLTVEEFKSAYTETMKCLRVFFDTKTLRKLEKL